MRRGKESELYKLDMGQKANVCQQVHKVYNRACVLLSYREGVPDVYCDGGAILVTKRFCSKKIVLYWK